MILLDKSITVVAPAYNHEDFIRNCLWSVASQNCPNMELVIIDDLSKDKTPAIIRELINDPKFCAAFDRGVKFIPHKVNKGAHYSINEGLEAASGHYLTVINTDDAFGPNRLNLLLNRCEEAGSQFAFGGIKSINQYDQPIEDGYGQAIMKYQETAKKTPTLTMALTRGNSTISTGNMVFTKELYQRLNGFRKYRYVHDWDFALRAALLTEPVFVEEAIYYYRLHTHNTISEISQNAANANAVEGGDSAGEQCAENPLIDFLMHILKGEYENSKIPPMDAWDYFFANKKYFSDDNDALWAWNQAKEKTKCAL